MSRRSRSQELKQSTELPAEAPHTGPQSAGVVPAAPLRLLPTADAKGCWGGGSSSPQVLTELERLCLHLHLRHVCCGAGTLRLWVPFVPGLFRASQQLLGFLEDVLEAAQPSAPDLHRPALGAQNVRGIGSVLERRRASA